MLGNFCWGASPPNSYFSLEMSEGHPHRPLPTGTVGKLAAGTTCDISLLPPNFTQNSVPESCEMTIVPQQNFVNFPQH